jgi:hypothetical protein
MAERLTGQATVGSVNHHRLQVLRNSNINHVRTIGRKSSGNQSFPWHYDIVIDCQYRIWQSSVAESARSPGNDVGSAAKTRGVVQADAKGACNSMQGGLCSGLSATVC